jgi:hypothetical protein
MNPYDKLLSRKRTWTPVQTTAGKVTEGAEEVIYRALAIRHMELPVGDFISDALNSSRMLSTMMYQSWHGRSYCPTSKTKSSTTLHWVILPTPWVSMRKLRRKANASHPDHTILKALVAERAIFFVLLPFFRFTGDAALRTVSADISRDEQVHVATNSLVCRELGLDYSPSLDKLRKATINWVMQPLKANNTNKYLNKKFWLDSSDRLMYEGKAPELVETKRARMPAFFEHANQNLPQYA